MPKALELSVENIKKRYGKRQILKGITSRFMKGTSTGILGPNGAGKTTLFYTIIGLIKPESGIIRLGGQDITSLPVHERARLGIGYLPQDPSIFRGLTVEENILAILELHEKNRKKRKEILEELLESFAITNVRKSLARTLSGGERRRLEIARALTTNPDFLLLDEPLAAIDPIAVRDIKQLVSRLKERGVGVVLTDHNVRETLGIVDCAYIIHQGEVLKEGMPKEIVEDKKVREVYLGEEFDMSFK